MKITHLMLCCVLLAAGSALACGQKASNAAKASGDQPMSSPTLEKTSKEYMADGVAFYDAKHFKEAIPLLQKALDLEKSNRTMERDLWIVLIDYLSLAYGVTGDIKHSQEVADYGIKQEPTYPMFYYMKACGFGEMDDEAGSIEYLRLAFKYKENTLGDERGKEGIPDPATDDSFQRLMKKESFRKALTEMKGDK